MAAIEQPDEPAAEERAGQRVARTDPVMPVVTRLRRRLLRRTPEAW